jgi:uncharacterized protein YkwD
MKLLIGLALLLQASKPEIRVPDLEIQIHQAVNLQRQANMRDRFEWDDTLGNLARAHSEDMAKRGYFKHITPEGESPMKRVQAAGYTRCSLVGENIHQNNLYDRVIEEKKKKTYEWNSQEKIALTTLRAWMDSADHRQSILDKKYTREGVGVAIAPDDKVYITQIFCGEAN